MHVVFISSFIKHALQVFTTPHGKQRARPMSWLHRSWWLYLYHLLWFILLLSLILTLFIPISLFLLVKWETTIFILCCLLLLHMGKRVRMRLLMPMIGWLKRRRVKVIVVVYEVLILHKARCLLLLVNVCGWLVVLMQDLTRVMRFGV